MAQSVSNEALWVKLSEVEQKVDKLLIEHKSPVPTQEPPENKPDFTEVKDEIITEIKEQSGSLNRHYDDIFKAVNRDIKIVNGNILKVFYVASRIRKQQKESVESQEVSGHYFNFRLFKFRKTFLVIAALGLLVLILTLFCMKQQNDYSLLLDGYYKQSIEIREMQKAMETVKSK